MEMQTLHGAFTQMQGTLSEHVGKLLELQNQEMQSRMLALQAQMNPHFLYNSLQALQAMADEGMNDEIAVMCQSMADILRYISSDSAQKVPLADELKHTRDYLRCMEIRYQGDLSYEIDVPEALDGVPVPKLCVQLLAENAIKFTTTRRPPYRIAIRGEADGVLAVSLDPEGREEVCPIRVSVRGETQTAEAPCRIPDGVHALYFTFRGTGVLDFLSFELKT
jgi:sensor histidine kinase YesM